MEDTDYYYELITHDPRFRTVPSYELTKLGCPPVRIMRPERDLEEEGQVRALLHQPELDLIDVYRVHLDHESQREGVCSTLIDLADKGLIRVVHPASFGQ